MHYKQTSSNGVAKPMYNAPRHRAARAGMGGPEAPLIFDPDAPGSKRDAYQRTPVKP